ncbi:MAG: fibronectin type III domain-containing protein [Bacteroidales bacterium]|nr:fibronectin type III domain-containing protein [Bacteroidales bacterium]
MKKLMLFMLAALLGIVAANAQGTGTIVVADGTATNSNVPFYGTFADDNYQRSQVIYPESILSDITGAEIQGITWYLNSAAVAFNGTFELKIGISDANAFASAAFDETTVFTTVYTGSFDCSGTEVTLNFSTPFTYTGGNLIIDFSQTSMSSSYRGTSFKGETSANASVYGKNGSSVASITASSANFIPKTGFIVPVNCVSPTLGTITPEARAAAVAWTENGSATAWQLKLNDGEWLDVTENPYTLTSLTPETAYNLQLRSNCGGGDFSIPVSSSFTTLVSCPAPTTLTATAAETSLELTWVENGSATEWLMKVDDGNYQSVTSPYTLTGLTANTAYAIQIRALCGAGDTSSAVSGTYRTLCATQATPYTEGFTDHTSGEAPNCWTTVLANGTYPKIGNNASSATDGNYLELYGSYSNHLCMVATPTLDRNANTLYLSFDAWLSSYTTDTLYVGLIDNPSDATTFTSVFSLVGTANGGAWTNYEINLSAEASLASSSSKYIAFRFRGSDDYCRLDNIVVSEPPACAKPIDFTLDAATDNSLTLSWTEAGSATKWVVKVGDGAWTETTENPYTINGLDANTEYAVSVRAFCDPDTSDAVNGTFRTLCGFEAVPYSEDFEGISSGIPDCWEQEASNAGRSKWDFSNAGNTGNCVFFEDYWAENSRLILPVVDCSSLATGAQMSFYFKNPITSNSVNVTYDVYYRTSSTGEWTIISDASVTDANADWTIAEFILPNSNNAAYYQVSILATGADTYSPKPALYIDDIYIGVPASCARPSNLTAEAAETSLTLSWNENGSATKWVVKVDDGAWTETTQNPYTINDLTANTEYAVSVRAFCDPDTSEAVSGTFRTLCGVFTSTDLPYFEGFEGEISCWEQENVTGTTMWETDGLYIYYSATAYEGTSFYGINGDGDETRLISPVFNLTGVDNVTLKFAYIQPEYYGDQDNLTVEYRLSSTSEWQTLATYTDDVATWQSASFDIPNPGATFQFAFRALLEDGYGVGIDSVSLSTESVPQPTCDVPTGLAANNVTANSAVISWTGSAAQYEVEFNGQSSTVTTNSYNATGLTAATDYAVRVRALCDGGLTSDWTAMVNFTTLDNGGVDPEPCGVPTNVAVSNVTTNSAFVTWEAPVESETFEGEWNLVMGQNDSVHTTITLNQTLHTILGMLGQDIADVDENVSVTGTQVPVTIEQGAGNQMNISGNFDMMMYGVDEPVTFHFNTTGTVTENGMNIEPANISESVAIMGTMNIDYTGTVTFEQPTELPEGGVLTIGIASMNITGYGDTVIYGQTGTVSISMTASDIEATGMRAGAGNSEPTYEVMITNTASGVENTYASATRTYSAEGLTAATAYTAKVRTVCGEGNYSEWSTAVPFTTLNGDTPVECDVPTNVATSNVTATSVTVSWTGTASEYQIEVSDGGATPITITVSASPYTVEGLTAATNYTVRVRALCEDDETSDWSASASFTTLDGGEPGPQGIDGVNASYSVSVYPNPATNHVTVSVEGLTGKAQVSVVDMSGRTVMSSAMEGDAMQLNVTKLAQGTYFVRIEGENISTVRKLVVK